MGDVFDFLFGRGALKKAAGTSAQAPAPAQPAGIDIAAEAQKMADRAKGNDGGIGARGMKPAIHPNDVALKSRAGKLAPQPVQPNDIGLKGKPGSDDDD